MLSAELSSFGQGLYTDKNTEIYDGRVHSPRRFLSAVSCSTYTEVEPTGTSKMVHALSLP